MALYRSFLIVNPFGIGDVLFSTPLMENLKTAFPAAKIYYLCNKKTYPVIQFHPLIEKAFIYERDEFEAVRKRSFFAWVSKAWAFISEIRREKIDVCIDLSLNTQYGFFAWLAGITRRYGLDYKQRAFFLNRKISIPGFCDKHVADYYLDCLRCIDITPKKFPLSIGLCGSDAAWAREFQLKNSIQPADLVIGIAPCGGDAFGKDAGIKRWPGAAYAELINRLRVELKATVLIFAGPKEKKDVEQILGALRSTERVHEFTDATLGQTIALVNICSLFVGNDTGPLRFADALHKKIVAFFGPVDETVYGPYPTDKARCVVLTNNIDCRPCYRNFRLDACLRSRECLTGISVEQAFAAIKKLLV